MGGGEKIISLIKAKCENSRKAKEKKYKLCLKEFQVRSNKRCDL